MANLTITIDDEVLKRARLKALEQGTSVNAVLREYLEAYAGVRQRQEEAIEDLLRLSHGSRSKRGGKRWTREEIATKENKKKGEAARSLLSYGWLFFNLKRYKEGKVSLETLAKELDLSISETIDLLSEYGITSPVSYDDYLEGLETLKKL